MDLYQEFIHKSRYARWNYDLGRRETWEETVLRVVEYWEEKFPELINTTMKNKLFNNIKNLKVMPSMRTMMTAGPALDKSNIAGYNCAFVAVDDPYVFSEALYILMNGTGLGYSVETQAVDKLFFFNFSRRF